MRMQRRAGAMLLAGAALTLTSCSTLSLREVVEALAIDVGQPDLRHNGLRLRVAGDGTGSSTIVYFRNSHSAPVTLVLTTGPYPRVWLEPAPRTGGSFCRTVGPGGARECAVPVAPNNAEAVGVRVTALSVGNPGEPGARLRVRSERLPQQVLQVWIEPSEGQWRAGPDLGIVAVHAALMRSGQEPTVVMFSPPRVRNADESFRIDRSGHGGGFHWGFGHVRGMESRSWNLRTNEIREVPGPAECTRDLFCSGHAHLPDGRLFVAGGHIRQDPFPEPTTPGTIDCPSPSAADKLHVIGATDARWSVLRDRMRDERWYPTVTTMPDGRMLITSGSGGTLTYPIPTVIFTNYYDWLRKTYELFDPATGRLVTPSGGNDFITADYPETYPGVFVLPSAVAEGAATVFAHERNRGWLFEYTPDAARPLTARPGPFLMAATVGNRSYPHYGASVLLPLPADGGRARVLLTGGQGERNADHHDQNEQQEATATAEVFDFFPEAAQRSRFRAIGSMRERRFMHDATLLPDGEVLITGGARRGWTNVNSVAVLRAELFDPETETFRPAAAARQERRYHAVALLLPDATVLKAGSTGGFGEQHLTQPVFVAERYLPPYLWRNVQPRISAVAAPGDRLSYRSTFEVTLSSDATAGARFALMRLGSVTHSNDMGQRLVWLPVVRAVPGDPGTRRFTLRTPRDGSVAPPGDYMLFAVDDYGVPSRAYFLNLR